MSPFEYGSPGSRSEMTTCGILLASLIAPRSWGSRSSLLAHGVLGHRFWLMGFSVIASGSCGSRSALRGAVPGEIQGLPNEAREGRIGGPVVDHHDLRPAGGGSLGGHVDGSGFQFGEKHVVAFALLHVLFQPLPVGEVGAPSHDPAPRRREALRLLRRNPFRGRGSEEDGPPPYVLERY